MAERLIRLGELLEGAAYGEVLTGRRGLDAISRPGVLLDAVEAKLLVGAPVGEIHQIEGQGPRADIARPVGPGDPPVDLRCGQAPAKLQGDRGLDGLGIRSGDVVTLGL